MCLHRTGRVKESGRKVSLDIAYLTRGLIQTLEGILDVKLVDFAEPLLDMHSREFEAGDPHGVIRCGEDLNQNVNNFIQSALADGSVMQERLVGNLVKNTLPKGRSRS